MKFRRLCVLAAAAAAGVWHWNSAAAPPAAGDAGAAVRTVMAAESSLRDVPLRDVVAAATGHAVLPFMPDRNPSDEACRRVVAAAADAVLTFLNASDSPVRGLRRINEASRAVEEKLAALLNAGDFTCAVPRTTSGGEQRPGYPDLRLVHRPTGRVYFLDPKIHEAGAAAGTLRTFYYEPKELTGKIHDDACHLILGIAHDGREGAWTFTGWKLVNLHDFRVRLKAEFQASNRDLYREELIVGRSQPQ